MRPLVLLLGLTTASAEVPPPDTSADTSGVVQVRARVVPTHRALALTWATHGIVAPLHTGTVLQTGAAVVFDGWVVTNAHVVAAARELEVVDAASDRRAAISPSVVRLDPAADVAWIPFAGGPMRQLAAADPAEGDPITLVGFPDDGPVEARPGTFVGPVTQALPDSPLRPLWRVDAPVTVGMSGGPVLDATGAVVGLVVAGSTDDDALGGDGLAVPRAALVAPPAPPGVAHAAIREDDDGWTLVKAGHLAVVGVRDGDRVVAADGQRVRGFDAFAAVLNAPGHVLELSDGSSVITP